MANELITFYERYKQALGDKAYRMEDNSKYSRVKSLIAWIKEYTPKGGRILDVGCGDMYLAKALPEYEWVGVDIAPDMSNNKAIKVDLMSPPYPVDPASFDTVICSEVLEHLWDLRVVHQEVKRVLKPNGTYILSTPNYDWIDHQEQDYRQLLFHPGYSHLFEHIRQYNLESHTVFLKETGFQVDSFTGADAHYSQFFAHGRVMLQKILGEQFNVKLDEGTIDQIIGVMFPTRNHTIMIAAKHGNSKPK